MHYSLSRVWLFATSWTVARRGPLSMGFYRQEYWSGLPFPSPGDLPNHENQENLGLPHCRQILYWTTRELPGNYQGSTTRESLVTYSSIRPEWVKDVKRFNSTCYIVSQKQIQDTIANICWWLTTYQVPFEALFNSNTSFRSSRENWGLKSISDLPNFW